MALRVKPYFFPERWMVMGERSTLTAGKKSLLGEESRDDGLDEKEWGDIGLARGEKPPCCSTGGRQRLKREIRYRRRVKQTNIPKKMSFLSFLVPLTWWYDDRQGRGRSRLDDLVSRSGVAFFSLTRQMLMACPAEDQIVGGPRP